MGELYSNPQPLELTPKLQKVARMGYGSRAISLLSKYFSGELIDPDAPPAATSKPAREAPEVRLFKK